MTAGEGRGLSPWHPASLLASWFGAGFLPLAPGSWGSLAALPVAWGITAIAGAEGLAVAAAVIFFLGWWAAEIVAERSGLGDPGFVVVDEVAAQWLVLLPAGHRVVVYALAFLLFRLCDVLKPWPARLADRNLEGGFGIMLDDTIAAGYALAALLLVLATGAQFGVRF